MTVRRDGADKARGQARGVAQRAFTAVSCLAIVVIGLAIVVRTLVSGGGAFAVGLVVGVLFVLAGGGRLWIAWKGF